MPATSRKTANRTSPSEPTLPAGISRSPAADLDRASSINLSTTSHQRAHRHSAVECALKQQEETMTNSDYIDAFVNGFVVRQQLDDRYAEADQHRLIKQYRAAHPEVRTRAKFARMLRRAA